jgi:Ulp1 family protease
LKSKLAKTVPKQELAKQYDEYIAQKAVQSVKPKSKSEPKPDPEPKIESEEEEEETIIVKKPKKKIKKKIIFESESDDEEAVVVHKKKPTQTPKPPLENLVYQSNKDQLYQRMVEERIKHAMVGYGNSLGV